MNMSSPLCFTLLSPRTCRIDLRCDWTNTAPRLRSFSALFGSEHVFPNHRFVGGGFFDAVRAASATAARFEIVEHSAFRSSLFGIGSGGDNDLVASALSLEHYRVPPAAAGCLLFPRTTSPIRLVNEYLRCSRRDGSQSEYRRLHLFPCRNGNRYFRFR